MIRWIASSHQYKKRIQITSGVVSAIAAASVSSFLLSNNRRDSTAVVAAEQSESLSNNIHDIPTRLQQIERLSENKQFDVLVVGGGATGSGVALDAATRGLQVALIERGDFGNETSSRSTKLLWAGIRYIATATASLLRFKNLVRPIEALKDFSSEFHMVRNCHKERRILLENNPHLTNWVPIAVPIDQWISWPPPFGHPLFATAPMVLPLVFKFYDGMSGFTCPPSHIMSRKRAERKFPQLASEDAKYYCCFYEGQHNDARTATYIALTAAEKGACVTNYTEMIQVIKDKDTGKAIGVKVRDRLNGGKEFNVYAKAIIFAGGPFTDELRQIEDPSSKPAVAAAAGTHIVLPSYYCPRGVGMLDINTSDGRFLFFLPWQGHTLIGTTDRKGPAVSTPGPPEEEIEWLLAECQKYLGKDVAVRRSDVQSSWQGFRPLASDPNAQPGAPVSRDHIISTNPTTGITFVTGGKWTTYREMAQDVLDQVVKNHGLIAGPCQTDKVRLRGGDGYDRNVPIKLVQKLGCSQEVAEHLAHTYGMYAFEVVKMANATTKSWPRYGNLLVDGFPYLESEVEFACKKEMVQTVKDMLTLRIPLAFLNSTAAEKAAPRVAEIMAKSLGWNRAEKNHQLEEAMKYLDEFGGPIPKQKQRSIKSVEDLFNAFDTDKSGYIEYEELKECLNYWGAPFKSEEEAQAAFKSMDKKKDNRISLGEFKRWWNDPKNKENRLKLDLSEKYRFSTDKLGKGASSRGAAFG
jgi:glycerol-3-phosphate dehydrogenase